MVRYKHGIFALNVDSLGSGCICLGRARCWPDMLALESTQRSFTVPKKVSRMPWARLAVMGSSMMDLHSTDGLEFLFLLLVGPVTGLGLLKLTPAVDALVARGFPVLLMLALALPHLQLLVLLTLFATFLLHLGFHLAAAAVLVIDEDLGALFGPFALKLGGLELGAIHGPLVLADQQHAGVGNGLVEPLAVFLIHQLRLGLLEPVEGVRRQGVLGLVWMDEEGLLAIRVLDVGLGDAGFEAQDGIATAKREKKSAAIYCAQDIYL